MSRWSTCACPAWVESPRSRSSGSAARGPMRGSDGDHASRLGMWLPARRPENSRRNYAVHRTRTTVARLMRRQRGPRPPCRPSTSLVNAAPAVLQSNLARLRREGGQSAERFIGFRAGSDPVHVIRELRRIFIPQNFFTYRHGQANGPGLHPAQKIRRQPPVGGPISYAPSDVIFSGNTPLDRSRSGMRHALDAGL